MAVHFTLEEFSDRKSKVIKELKKQNLDGLLMFRQESMYWLTGYDTFGYVYFQCLILTAKGDLVLLTRAPDLRQAQNTSIIKDIRIWIDKDNANPAMELKNILSELGLEKSNLGVEYEAYGLTGRNAIRLNNSLINFVTLHDKSELVSYLRVIKSEAEIVFVKKAAKLADDAMEVAWQYARAGQSEAKILAEMQSIIFEGGGDYPANEFIVGSGKNALLCRYQSEKRKLGKVDQLSLEWAGAYKHYHSCLFRTIPIGKVNNKQKKMHAACIEALSLCEKKLKSGNKAGDVFDAHAEIFDRLGYKKSRMNACGYSLGTTFSPNWMDWPMLYKDNPITLASGMIFFIHMILMDSENQLAMNLGETYLITDKGNERLGKKKLDLVVC
jgi:Xaa-Pro dipeptidase|tara:strand:+ start:6493 stop:7644 length:1152 start_codon:yes stop_codon:yes gene_type:complete